MPKLCILMVPLLGTFLLISHGQTLDLQDAAPQPPASLASDAQVELPNHPDAGLRAQSFRKVRIYYVDSVAGDNAGPGTSLARPWKNLSPLNARTFAPGDVIAFKRGSVFSGTALALGGSGTLNRPILITAYGQGTLPTFKNPGALNVIRITGDHVIVNALSFQDTTAFTTFGAPEYEGSGALLIRPGADSVTVLGSEFTRVGLGVKSYGLGTRVIGNNFHDLSIAYRDNEQSYGAVGVSLNNSGAEVAYNRFTNCRSTDSPYGADGGAIEIEGYSNQKNRISIHHNVSRGSQGFLEVTESSSSDVVLSYNVSDDYQQFIAFDTTTKPSGYRAEHNTVIRTHPENAVAVFASFYYREVVAPPSADWLSFRNNVFYVPAAKVLRGSFTFAAFNFPHDHNVYFGQPDPLGYPLGVGDVIADPRFVGKFGDLRLQAPSPAIGAGANLGYRSDLLGQRVPVGAAPDAGAYEFQGRKVSGTDAAPSFAPNLLTDPGFEPQTTATLSAPWMTDSGPVFGVDLNASRARTGRNNAFISTPGAGFNAVKQAVSVRRNTEYRLLMWIRSSDTICETCGHYGVKTIQGAVVNEFTFMPVGEYTQIGVDFNSGDNAQVCAQIGYHERTDLPPNRRLVPGGAPVSAVLTPGHVVVFGSVHMNLVGGYPDSCGPGQAPPALQIEAADTAAAGTSTRNWRRLARTGKTGERPCTP